MPSMRVDNICKEKCAAILFRNAAQELAAYKGMQLRVFVDGLVDTNKQAIGFEPGEVRLKIQAGLANVRLRVTTHWKTLIIAHDYFHQ